MNKSMTPLWRSCADSKSDVVSNLEEFSPFAVPLNVSFPENEKRQDNLQATRLETAGPEIRKNGLLK
jgi:hypothetical protein